MPGLIAEQGPWPRGATLLAERARFDCLQKPDLSIKIKGSKFLEYPYSKFGYNIVLSTVVLVHLEDRRGLSHSQLVVTFSKLVLACANSWSLALAGGP